jgi:hypothetical protein
MKDMIWLGDIAINIDNVRVFEYADIKSLQCLNTHNSNISLNNSLSFLFLIN